MCVRVKCCLGSSLYFWWPLLLRVRVPGPGAGLRGSSPPRARRVPRAGCDITVRPSQLSDRPRPPGQAPLLPLGLPDPGTWGGRGGRESSMPPERLTRQGRAGHSGLCAEAWVLVPLPDGWQPRCQVGERQGSPVWRCSGATPSSPQGLWGRWQHSDHSPQAAQALHSPNPIRLSSQNGLPQQTCPHPLPKVSGWALPA